MAMFDVYDVMVSNCTKLEVAHVEAFCKLSRKPLEIYGQGGYFRPQGVVEYHMRSYYDNI